MEVILRIFITGLANKRLLLPVFLLLLTEMVFTLDIKIIKPRLGSNNPLIQEFIQEFNEEAERLFMDYENLINSELNFLPDSVPNLAGAFANTSVFSSDGASQRGYEGYNIFSFTIGFMGALQFPKKFAINGIMDTLNGGEEETGFNFIKDNMDIGLGLDVQAFNIQIGINTSKFLLENLYLGFKFSMFDTNRINVIPLSGFSFKTTSVGITASYQLITQKRLLGSMLIWRGLNLGTGFIWQNTSLELSPATLLDEDLLNFSIGPIEYIGTIDMQFNQSFHLGIKTNTYIIPVEVMTSMRLLWFLNLAIGAGVDIAFGNSTINAGGSFYTDNLPPLPYDVTMDVAPALSYSLGGNSVPNILSLKIMGSAGFNLGPVIMIDIPVTYYPLDNGYSLGITFGLTF